MYVPAEKIMALIEFYGKSKGYPAKSYLKKFTEDWNLNYNQWQAYVTDSANAGIKVLGVLMEIFKDLNLNWVFKDDYNMFQNQIINMVAEPDQYTRENYDLLVAQVEHYKKVLNQINRLATVPE